MNKLLIADQVSITKARTGVTTEEGKKIEVYVNSLLEKVQDIKSYLVHANSLLKHYDRARNY